MQQPLLSILIVHHPNRTPLMRHIVMHLQHMPNYVPELVEILTDTSDTYNGRGKARNRLIHNAKGLYCAFVDDDDALSSDYLSLILCAIRSMLKPDIIGINGQVISLKDNKTRFFELSIKHEKPFSLPSKDFTVETTETEKGIEKTEILKRFSSHLCPIKTEIARKIRFPEEIRHEDNGYSTRLKDYIKDNPLKEVCIAPTLYYYFSRILIE